MSLFVLPALPTVSPLDQSTARAHGVGPLHQLGRDHPPVRPPQRLHALTAFPLCAQTTRRPYYAVLCCPCPLLLLGPDHEPRLVALHGLHDRRRLASRTADHRCGRYVHAPCGSGGRCQLCCDPAPRARHLRLPHLRPAGPSHRLSAPSVHGPLATALTSHLAATYSNMHMHMHNMHMHNMNIAQDMHTCRCHNMQMRMRMRMRMHMHAHVHAMLCMHMCMLCCACTCVFTRAFELGRARRPPRSPRRRPPSPSSSRAR